jgi:hypothetical protein
VKLRVNEPLKDEQFELPQPPGSQLVRLDMPAGPGREIPAVPAKTNKNRQEAERKPSGGGNE